MGTGPVDNLGALLRETRICLGWSLRAAERATGIPNAHICQIETGTIEHPGIPVLAKLAQAYGLPLYPLAVAAGHEQLIELVQSMNGHPAGNSERGVSGG